MTPEAALSPSLRKGAGPAFELKYVLTLDEASRAEEWARSFLSPDPHGQEGAYSTLSLYCDTPTRDVFHRERGYRRSKYRVRRYEAGDFLHLERKTRRGDRVSKKRSVLGLDNLRLVIDADPEPEWEWGWFLKQVRFRNLSPAARLGYARTAFVGHCPEGPMRLTIDRDLRGEMSSGWDVGPLRDPKPLLQGKAVLELKYAEVMPAPFRKLMEKLPPNRPGGASKYRLCMRAWGLVDG